MSVRTSIVIPARYASTRLPGKPLTLIAGKTMLARVVALAKAAAKGLDHVTITVATDDERIAAHCQEIGVVSVMTAPECPSGTDRVAEAVRAMDVPPDFILNVQGDAPLTPPDFLRALIDSFASEACDVVTPVTRMSWEQLDLFRQGKRLTPFSGTCAVFAPDTGKAFWFSKSVMPAIRKEENLRMEGVMSPVWRHIGVYGYARTMLEKYVTLPEATFEKLEGLEQLRVLEHGYTIRCVPVDYKGRANMSGVDSPEDVTRAEDLIKKHGELLG